MSRLLPSLDLLRGFEAAARLQSITEAAKELFLTQSAVSRQVKALEEQLGTALFERRHRQIRLTQAGHRLFRAASESMRLLGEAAASIREAGKTRTVTISCTISFATLWLVPRLTAFREKHPDIDIRIAANNKILDLEREQIELAIRYCPAAMAPKDATRLFGEEVFPVCSPALLNMPERPLSLPEDLKHHVLLQFDLAERSWLIGSWAAWLETMELRSFRPAGTLSFTRYEVLIEAAVEAQGVALGVTPLVQRHLQRGTLVAPFAGSVVSPRAYHLIFGAQAQTRPEVKALGTWLVETAKQEAGS